MAKKLKKSIFGKTFYFDSSADAKNGLSTFNLM